MTHKNRGFAAILALFFLLAMSGLALALITMYKSQVKITGADILDTRAFYVAEAGRAKARYALTAGGEAVGWTETASPFGAGNGTYVVTTEYGNPPANTSITIVSDGYIPNNTSPIARRSVKETGITGGGASGGNLSIGSTATASSSQGGQGPARAIDNNNGTQWRSNVNGSSWIKIDYGTQKTFNRAILVNTTNITSETFAYSDNNINWTNIAVTESPDGTYTFTPVTARYIRLTATGNRPRIGEFQTYSSSGLTHGTFSTSH